MQAKHNLHRASYGLLGSQASSGEGWKPDSNETIKSWINEFTEGRDVAAEFDLGLECARRGYIRIWNKKKKSILAVSVISRGGEARNQKRHVFFDVSEPGAPLEELWNEIEGVLKDEGVSVPSIDVVTTGSEFEKVVLLSSISIFRHLAESEKCPQIHVGSGPERFAGAVLAVRAVTDVVLSIPLYEDVIDERPPLGKLRRFVLLPIKPDDHSDHLDEPIGYGGVTAKQVLANVERAELAVFLGPLDHTSSGNGWKRYIQVPRVLKSLEFVLVDEVSDWVRENLDAKSDPQMKYIDGCAVCIKQKKDDLVVKVIDELIRQKKDSIRIPIEKNLVDCLKEVR